MCRLVVGSSSVRARHPALQGANLQACYFIKAVAYQVGDASDALAPMRSCLTCVIDQTNRYGASNSDCGVDISAHAPVVMGRQTAQMLGGCLASIPETPAHWCLQTNFEGADLSDVLMDRCGT
jgi:hypothetical protein